ncbi:hypothetical protein WA026_007996, partial [Henosepilachna vigintioctopunctata]
EYAFLWNDRHIFNIQCKNVKDAIERKLSLELTTRFFSLESIHLHIQVGKAHFVDNRYKLHNLSCKKNVWKARSSQRNIPIQMGFHRKLKCCLAPNWQFLNESAKYIILEGVATLEWRCYSYTPHRQAMKNPQVLKNTIDSHKANETERKKI